MWISFLPMQVLSTYRYIHTQRSHTHMWINMGAYAQILTCIWISTHKKHPLYRVHTCWQPDTQACTYTSKHTQISIEMQIHMHMHRGTLISRHVHPSHGVMKNAQLQYLQCTCSACNPDHRQCWSVQAVTLTIDNAGRCRQENGPSPPSPKFH